MKTVRIEFEIANEAAERFQKSRYDIDRIEGWRCNKTLWDLFPSQGPTINGEFVFMSAHNPRIEVVDSKR